MNSNIANHIISNWFDSDLKSFISNDVKNLLKIIKNFLKIFRLESHAMLILINIQKYVEKTGRLKLCHIFNVFITSTMIIIKISSDTHISNSIFSNYFSIPLQRLNNNELNFLYAIDFDIYAPPKEISIFNTNQIIL